MHYVMNELQISKSSIEYYSIAHSERLNGISLKIVSYITKMNGEVNRST